MHLDVQQLNKFYYRGHLGRAVQSTVQRSALTIWPECKGQTVVGFGFAVPFLRPFLQDARRVVALMPGPQGVIPWPADAANVSVLCEEMLWPLETGHVDKLLLVHALENSKNPAGVLREAHRVLGPGGSAIFVVANRAGLWSRSDKTPFGYGRPYSAMQLDNLLKASGFVPDECRGILYQPPSELRFWLKMARASERIGRNMPFGIASGLLVVRATKRNGTQTGLGIPASAQKALDAIGKPATARTAEIPLARYQHSAKTINTRPRGSTG